jgi:hypothetical protein
MQEGVDLVKGWFNLHPQTGCWTTVRVAIPLQAEMAGRDS